MTVFVYYPQAEIAENAAFHAGIARQGICGNTNAVWERSGFEQSIVFAGSYTNTNQPGPFWLPMRRDRFGYRRFVVNPIAWAHSAVLTVNAYLAPFGTYYNHSSGASIDFPYSLGLWIADARWSIATAADGDYAGEQTISMSESAWIIDDMDLCGTEEVGYGYIYLWFELVNPAAGHAHFAGFHITEEIRT